MIVSYLVSILGEFKGLKLITPTGKFQGNTVLPNHKIISFSPHRENLDCQLHDARQLSDAGNYGRDQEVLDLLHRRVDPDIYLAQHWACYRNHPRSAELLIKWGASLSVIDYNGRIALHWACRGNSMDCVRLLLSHNSPIGEPGCVCSCV